MKTFISVFFLLASLIFTVNSLAFGNSSPSALANDSLKLTNSKNDNYSNKELYKLGIDTAVVIPSGLDAGQVAPMFSGIDQNGRVFDLATALEESQVLIFFYRGYWCPVCNRYLSEFMESKGNLSEMDLRIVAISPEYPENVKATVENNGIDFSVLSDTDASIMRAYDVAFKVTDKYVKKINTFLKADIATANDADEAWLPVPASFLISQKGIIQFVYFDPDYKNRAESEDLHNFYGEDK